MSSGPGKLLLVLASLTVVAVLAIALWVVGSPAAQRDARLDQRRTEDLQRVERAVVAHWEANGSLPADLAALARVPGQSLPLNDPAGGPAYSYEPTGSRTYRLCASFVTDTADDPRTRRGANEDWLHAVGPKCFDRHIRDSQD